ncbi:hypothetical protein GCM10009801_46760 [Streptomyces albiaxialis]|uniref:Uncharacterized protein n=2 Tax=Streptomyces albiaxialis TaxID=329523 RepID=A0ABN2W763_9ACTN
MATPAGAATAAPAAEPRGGDSTFADCPSRAELPEGADPEKWRCEVMSATGSLKLGRISIPLKKPVTVTHAEGRIDGEFHQVFGGLKAAPIRVPRTPLSLSLRYGGYFDFHTNDQRMGELDLTFGLSAPGLPRRCSIGGGSQDAVHLILKAVGEPEPGEMPEAVDSSFTVPRTSGCGPFGPVLDKAIDLPSPSGENAISLNGERQIRPYAELP